MSFSPKHEVDMDAFKQSGSEEDDVGYHSIGRNIKVKIYGFMQVGHRKYCAYTTGFYNSFVVCLVKE